MKTLQAVRGTHDLIAQQAEIFRHIDNIAWQTARLFGYQEISTPIIESTEVFKRSLGDATDIVNKEMHTFSDRGGDQITLRPEGTAGVARAFISNGLTQSLPLKLYYHGPMFRYERPQKGRQRQFHQLGAEVLGLEQPASDVEVIAMAWQFLKKLGLEEDIRLEINTLGDQESRLTYRNALVDYYSAHKDRLSKDSLLRLETNPLRILDSKDEGDKELNQRAPLFDDFINQPSKEFFTDVKTGLEDCDVAYRLNPYLVRGLDYYCHTVFEFTTDKLGAQNAVLSGGRYDKLIEIMGGKPTPGIGWAAGMERLALLLENKMPLEPRRPIALLPMGDDSQKAALPLALNLREKGFYVEQTYSGNNAGKLMKKANKWRATAAVLIGDEELKNKKAAVKNLDTGEQESVGFDELTDYLANKFAASKA